MNEIQWAEAFQVFLFGFGGVFLCLVLLTIAIRVSGSVIKRIVEKKGA